MRRLSVFVGPFTLEAAQAILSGPGQDTDEIVSRIVSLVDRSLLSVVSHDSPAQYRLLETTRAYGMARLAQYGETDVMAHRHARYFTRLFRSAEERSIHCESLQNLGNVRAALEWSFSEHGDAELGTDLVLAVAPVLLRLSWLAECRRWSARALAALPGHARGSTRELDLLELLAGSTMFSRGNAHEVRAAIQRALDVARRLGNTRRELDLLGMLNVFLGRIGEFEQALRVAQESSAVARAAADEGSLAVSEWMLGVAQHLIGDQALAQRHCEAGCAHDNAARSLRRDVFGYDHRVRALVVRARALWLRGFPEQAGRVARDAIDAAERLEQPVTECLALIYTAPVFLWGGDLSAAERAVSQVLEKAREHSLEPFHAVGRGLLGRLLIARGQRDAGIELLLDALERLDEEQHLIQVPEFVTYLAEAVAARGESHRALASIDRAMVQRARSGSSFDMPEILRVKGTILLSGSERDRTRGLALFSRSVELAQTQSSLSWALRTATSAALEEERDGPARRALAQIYGRFTEGFETPDLLAAQRVLGVSSP